MSSQPIRRFPDPLLKQPSTPVARLDAAVSSLIDALITTMRRHPRCVGLAAPQIGRSLRVAVMDASRSPNVTQSRGLLVLVNPTLEEPGDWTVGREGCLSIPDFTANVRRATRVRLWAQDRNGAPYEAWLEGFEAIIAQHETDHLDGLLFLDRAANLRTDVFPRKTYL